ncbi:hypothetical protein H6F95_18250 [Cyanobacteria bacterium FACHB-471]|nr:hypothetical protein [Cyanobacteria bacterium FACHB-471]
MNNKSGRDVMDWVQLAKEQDCTILVITDGNCILDVANHIIHREEGRLTQYCNSMYCNPMTTL